MSIVPASSYSWFENDGFYKKRHLFFGTPCRIFQPHQIVVLVYTDSFWLRSYIQYSSQLVVVFAVSVFIIINYVFIVFVLFLSCLISL